jgi:ribosome-associated translation inhibitor RaiA
VQTLATPTGPAIADPGSAINFSFEISFKDTEPSDAARFQIAQYLAKLGQLSDRITDCRVVVSIPHKRSGNRYFHIHATLDLPGKRLAVSREPETKEEHTDIHTAISACFHKLTRQMEDYLRTRG